MSTGGVELRAHVVIRGADKRAIAGATVPLDVRGGTVSVGGSAVPVPAFDELEHFVDALLHDGALIADEEVRRALGMVSGWSARTWQRRIARVTGMTRGQLERTERARAAYHLLQQGVPPAEAAHRAGFADQPHLTREMRRFAGQTPAGFWRARCPTDAVAGVQDARADPAMDWGHDHHTDSRWLRDRQPVHHYR